MDRFIFRFVSKFTELFPNRGAKIADWCALHVAGNTLVRTYIARRSRRMLKKIGTISSVCVVADMNIGDAVMIQSAITALRELLPNARIDYVFNRNAAGLVSQNPDISHAFPIYSGFALPTRDDRERINGIFADTHYDLVLNFCHFVNKRNCALPWRRTIGVAGLSGAVLKSEHDPRGISHMIYRIYSFVYSLFPETAAPRDFPGVRVFISPSAIEAADSFLREHDLNDSRLILFNPDATSRFTMLPVAMQVSLLKNVLRQNTQVLLRQPQESISGPILDSLSDEEKKRLVMVPRSMSLDVFAALIDRCRVFFTADGGTMHIAAAKKECPAGTHAFLNATAVVSVFGATPPRIYGYDSKKTGFFAANQRAASRAYVAESTYRNIFCIAKHAMTYSDETIFFKNLDIDDIVTNLVQAS